MKTLVVVESAGKIKKVQSILGPQYIVMASNGHILDLPAKTLSIDIENNFEPDYKPTFRSKKTITALKTAFKKCDDLLIASDKDREGEMIAWSIAHVLKVKNPKRLLFDSITKSALLESMIKPGRIDQNIVDAAKARRILDRLVGYKLSPLLWKNVKPKLSAGRVQSVISRIIVDRETEIEKFILNFGNGDGDYSFFKIKGLFSDSLNNTVDTILYEKNKIAKLSDKKSCIEFIKNSNGVTYVADSITTKPSIRNPSAPFTTSTLQQDASRKLGFSVIGTMRSAQILYEAGLITYMRTDSVNLSNEAMDNISKFVKSKFGTKYYKKKKYKTKSNNAQEAHEAVRPTDVNIENTNNVKNDKIGYSEEKLYNLIWKRTVASQMAAAKFDVTTLKICPIVDKLKNYNYRSIFKKLAFDGFLKVYNIQNVDDEENEENESKINIKKGDSCNMQRIFATQDFKKPKCRYNEASLIDTIDSLNIGRPATQANIITRIVDMNYVEKRDVDGIKIAAVDILWKTENNKIEEIPKDVMIGSDKNKFVPTNLGKLVNEFLVNKFEKVMDYKFTSDMEEKLDEISQGKLLWNNVLDKFYASFKKEVDKLSNSNYIQDKHTRILGKDDVTGYDIISTHGMYGPMVKLCGPTKQKSNYGPIKKPFTIKSITLEQAKKILEYPKEVGKYKRKKIVLQIGKDGLYLKYGGKNYSIGEIMECDLTIEKSIELIESKNEKSAGIGQFESDKKSYTIIEGSFSKCILVKDKKKKKGNGKFIGLPEGTNIEELTLEKVEEIVDAHYKKPKYKKYVSKKKFEFK